MWQKECADRERYETESDAILSEASAAGITPPNAGPGETEPTEITTIASITPDGKIVYRYVEMPVSEIRELQVIGRRRRSPEAAELAEPDVEPAAAALAAAADRIGAAAASHAAAADEGRDKTNRS